VEQEQAELPQVEQELPQHDQEHEQDEAESESGAESEEDDFIPSPPQPGTTYLSSQFGFRARKSCRFLNMDAADTVGCSVVQDSYEDYIPQIVDSDIDLQDDDDLFDKHVDCEKGKGQAVQEEVDDPTEDVDMCLPSSD